MLKKDDNNRETFTKVFNLNDADKLEQMFFKFNIKRWIDFLDTVTGSIKGDNGGDFAEKWNESQLSDEISHSVKTTLFVDYSDYLLCSVSICF